LHNDNKPIGESFLEGGGELGALMRAHDWTRTALGPPEQWPRSLKTAVRIMLTSRQPFWLGWGPELTYLYNDPYKSIIGGKHPWALGRPFREVWSEIWDVVGPMADTVMSRNEGIYAESQPLIMERHGYQEETHYTFSYSPVPDDEGGIGGLICANTEDTQRVIGERQLALLREVASRASSARTWQDACRLAIEAMATNVHDIPFALAFVTPEGDSRPRHCAASPSTEALADEELWPIEAAMATQEPLVLALDPDKTYPQGAWQRPPSQAVVLSLSAAASGGRAGALVLGLNPFRRFDAGYRGFVGLVAGQVSAAMANAEAYEQERRRAESLAELDRAKTAFFSNVSHEFRTPLTLMLGPVGELLSRSEDGLSSSDRAMLLAVMRNGRRLQKLVNTLLDFARIEAGRAQTRFEPTDLASMTADLAANFRAACDQAGIGLEVDTPRLGEPAWVDRDMWEKVVLNLLSNAFKFTLKGRITVRLRERAGEFELSVMDTGSGIPAEHLPKMFERFHRVEGAVGRSHEGSGIGLALVQELVRLHGGTIEVASTVDVGTEFTVRIPKGYAHLPAERVQESAGPADGTGRAGAFVEEAMSWLPGAPESADAPVAPADAPRVLVADDNADLRQYLRRLLEGQYRVEAVANGEEALAALREHAFDLVISDVMMPRLDGFGLVREVRADARLRSTPIVLLSARAGEESRIAGMASGADDYLVKPFSARELLVRVGALIHASEARRKANEELASNAAQLEALLDAAPLGIYMVDQDFRIAHVNPIAQPVFGTESVLGQDFEAVIHRLWPAPYADDVTRRFRATLATGEPYFVPEKGERRSDTGAVEWYEWRVHRIPLPEGRFGVVCYFRDISGMVQARDALRESDRRKDEFLATLSHELRNPLAPIRNSLHLLGLDRSADGNAHRLHQMMERQVNHLVRLVDDLLEMSRISRGKLEIQREPVDLSTVVRNAIETAEPLVNAQAHRLEVRLPGEPVWLNGDPVRLAQVLANVLNNAAKYTPRGGHIEVSASTEGNQAVVCIRDSGPGIAAEDRERIFEMFTRGPDSGQGGLGIGLALARQLVALHGGSIAARSDGAGKGSEFVIRLPLGMAPAEANGVTGMMGHLPHKRILVIDDNRDAGDSLAMILRILGADTRVARSGAEGLETLQRFDADVVLLDIGMPEMDGYEVARRIRARDKTRPAIVAVTGWGQEQDRSRAREAGFDHHLVKPADLPALHALLASL
jgi:PAS domain S-box-containing protein